MLTDSRSCKIFLRYNVQQMMTSYDPALIFLPIANEILVLNSEVQEEGETELVFVKLN